mgnify:FL=1
MTTEAKFVVIPLQNRYLNNTGTEQGNNADVVIPLQNRYLNN